MIALTTGFCSSRLFVGLEPKCPPSFEGHDVPAVLTSGDHAAVHRWREREALRRTLERRPDLLADRASTAKELRILDELAAERDEGS